MCRETPDSARLICLLLESYSRGLSRSIPLPDGHQTSSVHSPVSAGFLYEIDDDEERRQGSRSDEQDDERVF